MQNYSSTDVKLQKTNVDSSNSSILHRALSTISANQTLVNNQRNILAKNYRRTSINDEIVTIDHNDADASFILPNLYDLSEDIRIYVMDNLIDIPTMVSLEETKRLNWWVNQKFSYPKLYPLITSGDGNCLLHATSLAMWGFHDHALSMRKALNETLITSKPNNSLYRRWRWTQSIQNKKYDLVFSEEEWTEEWKNLLRLSSTEPRISQTKLLDDRIDHAKSSSQINTGGSTKSSSYFIQQYYESLEEFHVYVLANNIRRPIIIYSDTILRTNNGEAISPIEFGGIYLPLEIPSDKCHKQPVFLAFDAAHFSPLVPMESNSKSIVKTTYRIPLIDFDTLDLLPIHFFIDPGVNFQWPVDEELSNEKINLLTNDNENRMTIIEKYLNLSKEYSSLNNFIPFSTITTVYDDQISSKDCLNLTSTTNKDLLNEINSTIIHKKSSRSSLNSFSKIIRRTFIEPFSSTKRASHKHHHHHQHHHSITNENLLQTQKSSPLVNRHKNILTIILTNFQPKRPKISDNMMKNYIDTCINEYHQKQINHDNENIQTNPQSPIYYRHHPSLKTIQNHQEIISVNTPSTAFNQYIQKNYHIDDNEGLLSTENEQFSTNINYVQQTQRKSSRLIQSNSLEMINDQHHYLESHLNGISNKSFPSQKLISSSSLKRQQSSSSDKNPNNQHLIKSIPTTNIHNN